MEIRLRQRLIGAVVLIGLAGIFFPWIFKAIVNTNQTKKVVISNANVPKPPAMPKIKETVIVLPNNQTITLTNSIAPSDNNTAPTVSVKHSTEVIPGLETVEFKPAEQVADENSIELSKAWVIELGTFEDEAHAQALLQQLQLRGFTAYTHTNQAANGKSLTRVLVGPEVKRVQAEKLLQQLDKELHLRGMIIAFHPT